MDHFRRVGSTLFAEDVSVVELAERFGTPLYVYSTATITRHVRVLQEGLADLDHLICYAVKANGNGALLELIGSLGCGFDAVSVGELARVLKFGGDPKQTILSGVGKRNDEIAAGLQAGVLYICVESAEELDAVAQMATAMGVTARVSVRVNPDVDAQTHPYIATGLEKNKFGVPLRDAVALFDKGVRVFGGDGGDGGPVRMVGATCHIGSQITSVSPFEDAAGRMVTLVGTLRDMGVPLEHVGVGGGLGIPYGASDAPPSPREYGSTLAKVLGGLGLSVVFEPGRVIVGNAGLLVTRVTRMKRGGDRRFAIIDAGMNDLLRPALYDAVHVIEPVAAAAPSVAVEDGPVDVVGPVCESADTFASGLELGPVQAGDLLALRGAGAYSFVMSSTYNGRPPAAEVLVDGDKAQLVRDRGTLADLWRGERRLDGSLVDDALPQLLRDA